MDVSTAPASSLFGLDEPICPYTGLRTFTEEEAIYFRGRKHHVAKCLDLLVEQRFVMITGASGDGKSSLVFAGMLPEVRAGFVQAHYSRWAVATFRPERSPLRNLAQALATALRLPDSSVVEPELEQGFSALVQLYQASELCPPATFPAGLVTAEQRQATNLLVVVDQFEEFFTNPENYAGDQPNTAAQTVVNLLLETARLAKAENLPIYIVCTMRSDFVGQCAEFRGLIEQVGASQYFVPRLLRHEFLEVIKEPAVLSGNRISERLVQRLLYDIGQGQDQLPVLQHALRRIWLAADHGREEMDLIHYAMVGGLSDALPAADQPRFAAWRATLPAHQQQFLLGNPGLRNVLDAHANQLYFEANALYNQDFEPPLPPGTAERVIEQTFRVLTRTDGKRVVRSRITGAEITAILADEALPWPVVCRILRPFRAEGTTFLSPFLGEDEDGRAVLPPDAVLDISHESLIRNWNYLREWALSEAKDVGIAADFQQQASRWQESAENRGYLLPIGLYTFFSNWHANKKGADTWLAHYQGTDAAAAPGQEPATTPPALLPRYLKASRSRLWSQLLAARYGVWRLSAAILLPIVLLVAGSWWWAQRKQQSDYVASMLVQNGQEELARVARQFKNEYKDRAQAAILLARGNNLLKSAKTPTEKADAGQLITQANNRLAATRASPLPAKDMARFVLNADRLKDVVYRPWFSSQAADYTFSQTLNALADDTLALDIELNMYALVDNLKYDWIERENPYIQPVLLDLEQRLAQGNDITKPLSTGTAPQRAVQRRMAVLTARTIMALSYYLAYDLQHQVRIRPAFTAQRLVRKKFEASRRGLLRKLRDYVEQEIRTKTGTAPSPVSFGFCLRVLLGQGAYSPVELAFLNGLSPLNPQSVNQFNRFFPSNAGLYKQLSISSWLITPASGGYLTMAMVFAALQQPANVVRSLDMVRTTATAFRQAHPALVNPNTHEAMARNSFLDTTKANSCLALLPYLIKYGLLNTENVHPLLAKCAQASELSFNEVYVATVYDLLTVKPVPAVFDVSQQSTVSDLIVQAPQGGVNLDYLNTDRVSFSLPAETRDKAWAALMGATEEFASQEAIFFESKRPAGLAAANAYHATRNALFLNAYLAKMHGVYLHEIKHLPQSFENFGNALQALQQHRQQSPDNPLTGSENADSKSQFINAIEWSLGAPEIGSQLGTTLPITGAQDPIAFLRLPSSPTTVTDGTLALRTYYTCSFDAFFLYELRHEAGREKPDLTVVQLLDSVAYCEAFFPYPNFVLIKAVATTPLRAGSLRQQRNTLLLNAEEILRTPEKLMDTLFSKNCIATILKLHRQSQDSSELILQGGDYRKNARDALFQATFSQACNGLAVALARSGDVTAALAFVDSIYLNTSPPFKTIFVTPTKIRICEQAMLTNNQRDRFSMDGFLSKYLKDVHAGVVAETNPFDVTANILNVAASILPVCFWRPFVPTGQPDTISLVAPSLIYRLNNQPLTIGLSAPFKAYGLADKVYLANEEMNKSPFQLGFTRLTYINNILLGYAHLKTTSPGKEKGWYEYDEAELTLPSDYIGYSRCN